MGDRKTGHEQFRDLFKTSGAAAAGGGGGSREQTSVRLAKKGGNQQQSRSRPSTNSPFKNASKQKAPGGDKSSKSTKSSKTKADKRNKPSAKKTSGQRRKASLNLQQERTAVSENSNRRSKERVRTPTTPPLTAAAVTAPGSRVRTPRKKPTGLPPPVQQSPKTPPKWAGKDIAEVSRCQTVFENDTGGMTGTGGAATIDGGQVQLAAARIKERKLQWKKESLSPAKTDPRQQESSGQQASENEEEKKLSNEAVQPVKHEANVTVRDRTIFENDDNHPALVKEPPRDLQWAQECLSEPALRKKRSNEDKAHRGAVSERPQRETPPMKPPRGLPALVVRTPPQTPIRASPACGTAHTPSAKSPSDHRPLRLDPTGWGADQKTNPHSMTGSNDKDGPPSPADKPVSCYLAPNMQQSQTYVHPDTKNTGQVDSEPYDVPDKK
ncbi:hypothetical protein PRIPAC_70959 [Pristionchus pacificus]|uniref:Uncharacterized protein n=1 Tax=Pristionchus pacificus TaxID=54126 RepID=A0A2A6C192_PRIPA|nr:hypothetical protein PRIPAC_70959 [Pristionchus pacificus]|eukprot:PDM71801.1 hypothetical protein PRIPAC_38208 [Pristionchus pacificus]